ncbi:hypothetical protein D9M70_540390 [compost metagenome]
MGDLQLPGGSFCFTSITALEEQGADKLVIGQSNLAHVQASEGIHGIVPGGQFEPDDSGLVQQCRLDLIHFVGVLAEPTLDGVDSIKQVEVIDIAVSNGLTRLVKKLQQLRSGFVVEGEQLLPVLFRQPLIEMPKNQ